MKNSNRFHVKVIFRMLKRGSGLIRRGGFFSFLRDTMQFGGVEMR